VLGGILLTWTILADLFLFRGGILGDEWIVEELRQAMVYWHSLFEALFGTVEA